MILYSRNVLPALSAVDLVVVIAVILNAGDDNIGIGSDNAFIGVVYPATLGAVDVLCADKVKDRNVSEPQVYI